MDIYNDNFLSLIKAFEKHKVNYLIVVDLQSYIMGTTGPQAIIDMNGTAEMRQQIVTCY